ncbi:MAG: NUDIX hydrolase [Firmicutes bacterium]|nr:NUDIX hydrolase [Alicyclobacillaceae bacterium]MCL6498274.1 NUDIX hydrolase [Bacillota bacterium]
MAKSPSPEGIEVRCPSLIGPAQTYPAREVRFRPAAYGVWIAQGRVLLGRSVFTRKWDIPGGAVEPWETLEAGLVREFQEETGALVRVGPLVDFRDEFIAFFRHPYHSLRFYYLVEGDPEAPLRPDPDEVSTLSWLAWHEIDPRDCQAGDYALLQRLMTGGSTAAP